MSAHEESDAEGREWRDALRPDMSDVTRAASDWVAKFDRGLTESERAEWAAWQAADPRHAAEWAQLQDTWRKLDGIEQSRELNADADEVVRQARARRAKRWWRRVATVSAAAAVVLGVFAGWDNVWTEERSAGLRLPKENYRVIASTLQRTVLPDGSLAELNGDSRIEVDYSAGARRVRLLSGEGHFIVAKNPERPFFVTAGNVTVRAVGTAFNVRLESTKIEVLVTEGKVKLERTAGAGSSVETASIAATETEPALVEGQKAIITREPADPAAAVSVGAMGRAEIEHELGWQSTRLVFNNTPLDEVVEGFNRYNEHRLTLGDPKLRERALTGVFRADNREGFVRLLRASVDVKAELRTPNETVLLPLR